MASSIFIRRASPSALSKLVNPAIRPASAVGPYARRSFNTNAQAPAIGGDDFGNVDVRRGSSSDRGVAPRRGSSPFLSDWIDPFSPTRTLGQVFNLMDQLTDPSFFGPPRGLGGATGTGFANRGWDVKEDDKALSLKMEMPGLGKEDVKVSVESDTLVIKGEAKGEEEEEGEARKYSSRIQLPPNVYKLEKIKGEMKNGVLKLMVPKVKEEEGKHVREIQVE